MMGSIYKNSGADCDGDRVRMMIGMLVLIML